MIKTTPRAARSARPSAQPSFRRAGGSRDQGSGFQVTQSVLSAGNRQAGGSDRDDLGQPTPDPGRRTTKQ